jgi:hypothetical protein
MMPRVYESLCSVAKPFGRVAIVLLALSQVVACVSVVKETEEQWESRPAPTRAKKKVFQIKRQPSNVPVDASGTPQVIKPPAIQGTTG